MFSASFEKDSNFSHKLVLEGPTAALKWLHDDFLPDAPLDDVDLAKDLVIKAISYRNLIYKNMNNSFSAVRENNDSALLSKLICQMGYKNQKKEYDPMLIGGALFEATSSMLKAMSYFEEYYGDSPFFLEELYIELTRLFYDNEKLRIKPTYTILENKFFEKLKQNCMLPFLDGIFIRIIENYQFYESNGEVKAELKIPQASDLFGEALDLMQLLDRKFTPQLKQNNIALYDNFIEKIEALESLIKLFNPINDLFYEFFLENQKDKRNFKVEKYLPMIKKLLDLKDICQCAVEEMEDILQAVKVLKKKNKSRNKAKNKKASKKRKTTRRKVSSSNSVIAEKISSEPPKEKELGLASPVLTNIVELPLSEVMSISTKVETSLEYDTECVEESLQLFHNKKESTEISLASKEGEIKEEEYLGEAIVPAFMQHCETTVFSTSSESLMEQVDEDITRLEITRKRDLDILEAIDTGSKVKYQDLINFVENALGGDVAVNKGSRRKIHVGEHVIPFHQRHGRDRAGYVDPKVLKLVKSMLEDLGVISFEKSATTDASACSSAHRDRTLSK